MALKVITFEPSKVMTAVAATFTNLALRNRIGGLEALVFVVAVATAAMASFQPRLHLVAFFLGVTIT